NQVCLSQEPGALSQEKPPDGGPGAQRTVPASVGRVGRSVVDEVELDAAVVAPAFVGRVVVDGFVGTEAFRRQARSVDAVLDQPFHDRLGAVLAQRAVHRRGADVVGVTLYAQLRDLRVGRQDLLHGVEDVLAVFARNDRGAAGRELHLIADLDLTRGNVSLRAAVLLRVGVRRAGHVGAGVGVVRDPVLVAIGVGAAVGLGVVRFQARGVGAGVFVVDDSVFVAIGRAAVGLGVIGLDARDVGASVVVVDDPVLVAVRRRLGRRLGRLHFFVGGRPLER